MLTAQRQWDVRSSMLGSGRVTTAAEVYMDAEAAYASLALQLNDQLYFFGNV
jgi:hypothetical protein